MTFFIFNLRGVLVFLLGGMIAWLAVALVPLAIGYQIFYGLLIAALFSSLVSLATDRCDRPGLWQGYRVNCIQFYYPALGQQIPDDVGLNLERRLAVFGWPLAGGPTLLLVCVLMCWVVDQIQKTHTIDVVDLRNYTLASFISALIAIVFAMLTSGLRTLPRDSATSIPATAPIEVQPTTWVGTVAKAVRGGSTEHSPKRTWAYVAIVVGVAGLACNHFVASVRGQMALMILTLCPFLVSMGIGGLIDPRIIWSIRAEGRIYPWWVRAIGGFLAVSSIAISAVLILVVYRGKL